MRRLITLAAVVSILAGPNLSELALAAATAAAIPVVGLASTATGAGYWVADASGTVSATGDARFYGDMRATALAAPVVGLSARRDGAGYWMVGRDGGVFSFGSAQFFGSTGAMRLNQPVVGMTASPSGNGYWFVASDGGIFAFGDAGFFGSTGAMRLNRPIVGMASTPSGNGYWLVASDGGIFAFGDARFFGSTGTIALTRPIVAMSATPGGAGYHVVASDGGIFAFGDAGFFGSTGGQPLARPITGMATTATGKGYWLVGADGAIFSFGDAAPNGAAPAIPQPGPAPQQPAPAPAPATAPSAGDPGSYAFSLTNADGSPARWNPCAPIHYVVNPANAPASGLEDLHGAVARLSAASGLRFVFDGYSSEAPARAYVNDASSGASKLARPVLVGWTGPSDLLEDSDAGEAAVWPTYATDGTYQLASGAVALNANASLPGGFAATQGWAAVMLHELSHVVGLDHVGDPAQVMNTATLGDAPARLGAGDLAGLARLGQGSCLAP